MRTHSVPKQAFVLKVKGKAIRLSKIEVAWICFVAFLLVSLGSASWQHDKRWGVQCRGCRSGMTKKSQNPLPLSRSVFVDLHRGPRRHLP